MTERIEPVGPCFIAETQAPAGIHDWIHDILTPDVWHWERITMTPEDLKDKRSPTNPVPKGDKK